MAAMGRELLLAILYGLVPLCIVERLYESRQFGRIEMAESATSRASCKQDW